MEFVKIAAMALLGLLILLPERTNIMHVINNDILNRSAFILIIFAATFIDAGIALFLAILFIETLGFKPLGKFETFSVYSSVPGKPVASLFPQFQQSAAEKPLSLDSATEIAYPLS